jgi:nucleoside-diphosphate-sugar epimerase
MDLTDSKLSILGGTGFLGKNFVKRLTEKEIKSKLLIHKKNDEYSNESSVGDVLNTASLENFLEKNDVVVNFTGQISDNFEDYVKTNLTGAFNILNSCVKKQVKHIILISTINVYGEKCNTSSIETDPVNPTTHYSLIKSATEKIYQYYSENLNLNVTVLRFSHIYGYEKKIGLISNLISSSENQNPVKLSHNGNQERDFLYIDDAVEGIIKTLEHLDNGFTIYNISSGEKISTLNLIKLIKKISNSEIFYEKQNTSPDEKCIWASFQKAKMKTNFQPKVGLKDGLKKIIHQKKI